MSSLRPLDIIRLFWTATIVIEENAEFLDVVYLEVSK